MTDPVHAYLDRHRITDARVVALTGDASDRRYFRVIPGAGDAFVLAVHSAPFTYESLPFVNTARLFEAMPAPVPRILGHADDLGVLALEDLGDVTLQAHLGSAPPSRHAALYREAVGIIHTFQVRGRELASHEYLPYGIAFDVEKLTWELNFFIKHYLVAYRGAQFTDAEREALDAECAGIVTELAAERRVLCHRDYHSRNLMLHAGRLVVIDFQDARLGPDTYDLASLLRDSYVDLPWATVDDLIAYFLALQGRSAEHDEFRRRFDLMALQRNLKALGTFGYQTTARGNPVYIQYMPRTLNYVRENLGRYPRFARLRDLLSAQILELR
ncbi:MAG TPA: phosphotransferase [Vicinamibacterales bacterium]|nr:phosphotransferase [Vicinamibacterales bacterium]